MGDHHEDNVFVIQFGKLSSAFAEVMLVGPEFIDAVDQHSNVDW